MSIQKRSLLDLHQWLPRDMRKMIYSMITRADIQSCLLAHGCKQVDEYVLYEDACLHGYLPLLKWAYDTGYRYENGYVVALYYASIRGNKLPVFLWLKVMFPYEVTALMLVEMTIAGNLNMLKLCMTPFVDFETTYVLIKNVIKYGHVDILDWFYRSGNLPRLHTPGSQSQLMIYTNAVEFGRPAVIMWAINNKMAGYCEGAVHAAMHGRLDMVNLLYLLIDDSERYWLGSIKKTALIHGHTNISRWADEKN